MKWLEELTELLECPICKGDLELSGNKLCCKKCKKVYLIKDKIPVLLDE
ncbi:hypothetical protein HNP86_001146 [Methanococcus maripaludis]|uniref:Uncharacterized protein n=1 Tax=Methanococcus maripaludis TaxID=39152 RepID=A0A7J9NUN6_METMI|nr:Trm112 family protein [Methanococcus maripaludis]MBA2851015.1 hypothetical protein [Methanococcus maripaludis]